MSVSLSQASSEGTTIDHKEDVNVQVGKTNGARWKQRARERKKSSIWKWRQTVLLADCIWKHVSRCDARDEVMMVVRSFGLIGK